MAVDLEIGIRRLEEALAMLRSEQFDDWYEAYKIADSKARADENADWAAVRDLIVVATHGAPEELSYLDEKFKAMIDRGRD